MTRILRYVLCACIAAAVGIYAIVAYGLPYLREQQHSSYMNQQLLVAETTDFDVRPGMTVREIAQSAQGLGLISDAGKLASAVAREGVDRKIKAGRYRIKPNTTAAQFIAMLAQGDVTVEKFTIIEGQTASSVLNALLGDERFRKTIKVTNAARKLKLPPEAQGNPEGFLFPDTYLFDAGSNDINLLAKANRRMHDELAQAWEQRNEDLPYETPYDALIMASIIEKETGAAAERELVASVFVNRLRLGMRLQSDPTVIYGLGSEFSGPLTKKHLQTDSPYNTYTRAGLPPGPIALPGAASLTAATQPASTEYLYFVADGKGGHVFSRSLREHINAVNRYRRSLKK